MSDEFVKGLAVLTGGGLAWMTLSSWYNTPSFEHDQLIGPGPANPDLFAEIGLIAREAFFWFAIFGALTFWVIIPAIREYRGDKAEES